MRELAEKQAKFHIDTGDLAHLLVKSFSLEEIDLVAFDVGVDPDSIGGKTKQTRAMNLVRYCERAGLISQLILNAQEKRPMTDWPLLPIE